MTTTTEAPGAFVDYFAPNTPFRAAQAAGHYVRHGHDLAGRYVTTAYEGIVRLEATCCTDGRTPAGPYTGAGSSGYTTDELLQSLRDALRSADETGAQGPMTEAQARNTLDNMATTLGRFLAEMDAGAPLPRTWRRED